MAVNVTANWRLICAIDPLLKFSDAGRVVFVSSGVAHLALAYWGPYAVSKAALEALARTYAAETASTNVRVNMLQPRAGAHAHARPGHAGRRPDDARDRPAGWRIRSSSCVCRACRKAESFMPIRSANSLRFVRRPDRRASSPFARFS